MPYTQHHTRSEHTGEQEPGGPGHRTRNTTHGACTPAAQNKARRSRAGTTRKTHTKGGKSRTEA